MRQLIMFFLSLFSLTLCAQKAEFKVMTYNLMYYKYNGLPCAQPLTPSEKDAAFKTVFKATQPDILCVNEIVAFADNSAARSVLSNVINTDGEQDYTSAEYSNNGSSTITNMLFYDSTRFALKSQSAVTHALNNLSLVRVIDLYRLYYKDPGLKLGADTVFFTVVVAHLKAGNTSSDASERQMAAEALMAHLSNSVTDKNVIFCGDFNVYTSSESAYQELINYTVSHERFVDPVSQNGSWHNNSNFAAYHTQSTHSSSSNCYYSSGGMDDRFDFILMSKGIENSSDKMNFKFNSYRTIGNDGAHFNQSINAGTNTSVTPAMADALYEFSDHLPVVASFEVELSGIGLAENRMNSNDIRYNSPFANELILSRKQVLNQPLSVMVTSITGKVVLHTRLQGNETELRVNTSTWNNGIYLLSFADDQGQVITKKIIRESYGQ